MVQMTCVGDLQVIVSMTSYYAAVFRFYNIIDIFNIETYGITSEYIQLQLHVYSTFNMTTKTATV